MTVVEPDKGGWLEPGMTLVVNETGEPEFIFDFEQDCRTAFIVVLAGTQWEARDFARNHGLTMRHVIAPGWPSSLDGVRVSEVFTLEGYYRRPSGWRKSIEEQLAVAIARQRCEPVRHNVKDE